MKKMGRFRNIVPAALFVWALAGLGLFGPVARQAALHGGSAAITAAINSRVWVMKHAFGWK